MSYSQFNQRITLIVVEYDGRNGKRLQKEFKDGYRSRSFYVRMDRAGRNPRIVRAVR